MKPTAPTATIAENALPWEACQRGKHYMELRDGIWECVQPCCPFVMDPKGEPDTQLRICIECGNDETCEGYRYCSECLEILGHDADDKEIEEAQRRILGLQMLEAILVARLTQESA